MHTCGAWDQVLRFMSPLVIEDELLERGLVAFEDAVESLDGTPNAPRVIHGPPSHVGVPEPLHPASPGVPGPVVPPVPGRTFPDGEPS